MRDRDGQVEGRVESRFDPLARLRGFRVRADRAQGVGEDCGMLMRSLKKVSRDQSKIVEAWEAGAPDEVRGVAWVHGLKGGKLEIGVEHAAGRYLVDRWMRGGGLEMLRELGKVRIKSVVLRIGAREE